MAKTKNNSGINTKIMSLIIILLVILGIIIYKLFYVDIYSKINDRKNYLAGVHMLEISDSDVLSNSDGLLNNYQEYLDILGNFSADKELKEDDFSNNNYIYLTISIDSCSEHIRGVNKIKNDNGNIKVIFDVDRYCGVCAPQTLIYFIPIDKNIKVNSIKDDYHVVSKETCDPTVDYKPILYLYPTIDIDVTVKLDKPNLLLTTYPKYNVGWNVHVLKNGSIYDKDNNYYYALYWDENNINKVDFSTGFYVTKDDAIEFLEEKLSYIGLNDRERNEFIIYWLPKLEDNKKSLVYFELTEERELNNKLYIEPKPNSLLRVNMHIKKVNKKVNIKEQELSKFNRYGFVAVEWGGTIHK